MRFFGAHSRVHARWKRFCYQIRGDRGFSMIELVIALGLLSIVISVLTGALVSGIRPVLLSKQRAAANIVAQQALEQARSLSYGDVGLVTTDATIVVDPNVTSGKYAGETIVYATNAANHPFNPHCKTGISGVAGCTYDATFKMSTTPVTRWVWITQSGNLKRVTVQVQWSNPAIATAVPFVRAQTLISNSSFTAAGTPLTSATTVNAGVNTLTSIIGTAGTPDKIAVIPPATCEVDCGLTTTSPRNQMTCSARTLTIDHSAVANGSTFGGNKTSSLADDDPVTTTPQTDNESAASPSGTLPSDIYPNWLTQATLAGSANCSSTVLGPDGVVGNDDDLPYEHASSTGPPSLTLTQAVGSAVPEITGPVTMLDRADVDTAKPEAETTNDAGPIDTVVATTIQRYPDTRVIAFNMPTATPAIAATYGLLRVEAFTAAVTATGRSSGTPPAPSVSGANMRVWLYDPLTQATGCTRRSNTGAGEPTGYCVIDHDISTSPAVIARLDETVSDVTHNRVVRWVVNITEGTASTSSQTGSRGTTWTAQASPMTATVAMCAGIVEARSCTPDGTPSEVKALDLGASIDLGSVRAQSVYGFPT